MAQRSNRRARKQHGQGQQTPLDSLFHPLFRAAAHAPQTVAQRDVGRKGRGWNPRRSRIDSDVYLIANDSPRKLARFFEEVYRPRKLTDGKAGSIANHRRSIRALCNFAACEVTLDQLSDDLLDGLRIWLGKSGLQPPTVRGVLNELLAQWRYAYRKRLVDEPPRDVERPAVPKHVPEAWSISQLSWILRACAAVTGKVSEIPAWLSWASLVLCIYDTGLRIQALMRLRSRDLDAASGWVKAPAENQKQFADQVFRLSQRTLELLARSEPHGREMLFPWPFDKNGRGYPVLTSRYKQILRRAGLPYGPRDLFHKLRRTSATYVADAAGEIEAQKHMGHSCLQLTIDHYIDPTKLKRRTNMAELMQRPDWRDVG